LNYNCKLIKMRWFSNKKVLTDKQLSKVKKSFLLLCIVLFGQACVVTATTYFYEGEEYEKT
jgi:hypothetical protein